MSCCAYDPGGRVGVTSACSSFLLGFDRCSVVSCGRIDVEFFGDIIFMPMGCFPVLPTGYKIVSKSPEEHRPGIQVLVVEARGAHHIL